MNTTTSKPPIRLRRSIIWRAAIHALLLFPVIVFATHLTAVRFTDSRSFVWRLKSLAVVSTRRYVTLIIGNLDKPLRAENRRRNQERLAAALVDNPYLSEEAQEAITANDEPRDAQIAERVTDGFTIPIDHERYGFVEIVKSQYAKVSLTFVRLEARSTAAVLLIPWLVFLAAKVITWMGRRLAETPERCLACGYQLGMTLRPRCPECGQEFDEATRAYLIGKNADVPLEAIWEEQERSARDTRHK